MLGNKGMLLETIINKTIKLYAKNDIAIFHKKDVSIKFGSIEKNGLQLKVKNGYITKKSTTDYYGIYKGKFVTFEAKSTQKESLPLNNIQEHQIKYMNDIDKHNGISFLIIGFNSLNRYFMLKPSNLELLDKKRINIDFVVNHGIELELIYPGILDFASALESWI